MKRRFFLLAAPAIVAAPSLMRVSTAMLELDDLFVNGPFGEPRIPLSELITTTLRNRQRLLVESVMRNNAILRLILDNNMPSVGGIDRTPLAYWSTKGLTS